MILPREGGLRQRFPNTAVSVYSNESSVQHCGTITELQSGAWPDYQTYYVDCGGARGNMVYLTDLDTTACCGLNIAEVQIFMYQFVPRESNSNNAQNPQHLTFKINSNRI